MSDVRKTRGFGELRSHAGGLPQQMAHVLRGGQRRERIGVLGNHGRKVVGNTYVTAERIASGIPSIRAPCMVLNGVMSFT